MGAVFVVACLVGAVVVLYALVGLLEWRRRAQLEAAVAAKGLKLPPEISGSIPVLGHMLYMLSRGGNQLPTHLELSRKYGRCYSFRIVNRRVVVAVDPEMQKFVLSTGFKQGLFEKGLASTERGKELFGKGIFAVNGDQWLEQRNTASHLFHLSKMKQYIEIFHDNAFRLFDKLDSLKDNGPIDMQDMFMRYTLDSFAEIGFGVKVDSINEDVNHFAKAFDFVQTWTNRRNRYGSLWKLKETISPPKEFNAHLKYMDEFCWSIIERRSGETEEELTGKLDLLSILLLTNIQKPEARKDRDEMRDFIMNFLIAGRDTTAVMLTWCVHLLCENPGVYEKLLDEINTVLGDSIEPTWENTKDMRYVKQVLQETLRLYSPVPIDGLTATEDTVLPGNYFVEKGTPVLYVNWVLNRLEEYYPEPERFMPERWDKPQTPYAFLAFHGGPRQCLGLEMAYLEAKIMLCNLLRRYRFTHSADPAHKVDVKQAIILTALNGMHMNVERI